MGRIKLYFNVAKNFITGNTVKKQDIAKSYNEVSHGYDNEFIDVMHRYNVSMLSMLSIPNEARVLDLACGTGFNSKWIYERHPDALIHASDISSGMLKEADKKLCGKVKLTEASMLDFLKKHESGTVDVIVCSWALKYEPPLKVLRECWRVLKNGGQIGIIVNTKATLPEIRKIYKYLLIDNSTEINKLMMELPNPKNEKQLNKWFRICGFDQIKTSHGCHSFSFDSTDDAARWVTSTGALAGFDVMLHLKDNGIKNQISLLLEKFRIKSITHDFVLGVGYKCL
ncbi:class I SAM-dependent methyltransferase [Pseudobacteroides cellulosolvens]|uniref:Methyltransferase type 11 n=1 Tax=Pseudobacteroides cellulosolvens ATCC 35603 = DSM 2933 TaxID=398512 RepID=A0A0L6JL22_9FIRM|nr:class I SAM-dependent methyltransferase [Pseudobacteroides cellulosolvens]KNY26521.1 Methyltransferase type 11 [Pseudobacteroides cellulosolvens ATCC 35603 = DSM 2933]